MSTLASLLVKMGLDASKYDQGLDDAERKAGSAAAGISSKLQSIGSKMTGVGKSLSLGLTLPLVGAGTVALNAASDLEESMNKVIVVFGDSAAEIQAWSSTAATSFGYARRFSAASLRMSPAPVLSL